MSACLLVVLGSAERLLQWQILREWEEQGIQSRLQLDPAKEDSLKAGPHVLVASHMGHHKHKQHAALQGVQATAGVACSRDKPLHHQLLRGQTNCTACPQRAAACLSHPTAAQPPGIQQATAAHLYYIWRQGAQNILRQRLVLPAALSEGTAGIVARLRSLPPKSWWEYCRSIGL